MVELGHLEQKNLSQYCGLRSNREPFPEKPERWRCLDLSNSRAQSLFERSGRVWCRIDSELSHILDDLVHAERCDSYCFVALALAASEPDKEQSDLRTDARVGHPGKGMTGGI